MRAEPLIFKERATTIRGKKEKQTPKLFLFEMKESMRNIIKMIIMMMTLLRIQTNIS